MQRLKKGDKVRVISGKHKGKEGTILTVYPKENKATIDGLNIYKKHQKANQQKEEGGIIDVNVPLDMSKLALVDPKAKNKVTKIKFQYKNNSGKRKDKIRVSKATNNEILSGKK